MWLLLLIIPIALLTFVDFGGSPRDDYLGYLERRAAGAFAITTVFIYFFTECVALLTAASFLELLYAAAAYAAVLIVSFSLASGLPDNFELTYF